MSEAKVLAKAFGRAVLAGTLASGGPFALLLAVIGLTSPFDEFLRSIVFVSLPILVAAIFVIPSCLIFGLPIHFALRGLEDAFGPLIVIAAILIGFLEMWVFGWLAGPSVSILNCFLGAFSGGAAAWAWVRALGRWY